MTSKLNFSIKRSKQSGEVLLVFLLILSSLLMSSALAIYQYAIDIRHLLNIQQQAEQELFGAQCRLARVTAKLSDLPCQIHRSVAVNKLPHNYWLHRACALAQDRKGRQYYLLWQIVPTAYCYTDANTSDPLSLFRLSLLIIGQNQSSHLYQAVYSLRDNVINTCDKNVKLHHGQRLSFWLY